MDQLIYKSSIAELCIKAISADLVEPALVMFVSMLVRIICTTNVHYIITHREDTGLSRPDKACRAQSMDSQLRAKQSRNKGREVNA